MRYLITGGEFNNKGAEAMLLTALSNVIMFDKNATIYLFNSRSSSNIELDKRIFFLDVPTVWVREMAGEKISNKTKLLSLVKEIIKMMLPNKKSFFGKKKKTTDILKSVDVMIDISGFRLSSKWPVSFNVDYCNLINIMSGVGCRVYLMPQSFGPFDFKNEFVTDLIKNTLGKCTKVFAREKRGFALLKSLGLKNVEHSYDSVLIEKELDYGLIIKDFYKLVENIDIANNKNIAIIPNYRLVDRGGYEYDSLLSFYVKTINNYPGANVYLISHASEDLQICKSIKDCFPDDSRVHFVDHVLYSFNYQRFISKMDFIIASRYHAIIHAYKECTPAIILGWSDKYEDVASVFEQSEYVIDITDYDDAKNKISKMADSCKSEREIIRMHLEEVQKNNCYSFLSEIVNGNK